MKDTVLQAIQGSRGLISTVAARLECRWHTAVAYIEKWEGTRQAMDVEWQQLLDVAESQIHAAIEAGDLEACKWYLVRKGQDRGYGKSVTAKANVESRGLVIVRHSS